MREARAARTRKNVTLVDYEKDGICAYKLLGPTGEIKAFTAFSDSLLREPFNTRQTYCRHVADSFDYIYEAAIHLARSGSGAVGLLKSQLREILECWRDYLVLGEHSGKLLVRSVCTTLPSPYVSQETAAQKHAALREFLRLSERVREEAAQLVTLGLMSTKTEIDLEPLFHELNLSLPIATAERVAMARNSMLSGVIAGGPKKKMAIVLEVPDQKSFDKRNVFPLDLAASFIDCLGSYRDKAIYSFYAASGCRSIEGLQLLMEDVSVDRRTVRLVNPLTRANHPSYLSLTPMQRDLITWKGRETDVTFLIEPFSSMFFENLEMYLRHEHYPHNAHSFIFQVLKKNYRGKPYFLADTKTKQEVFKRAAERIGLPDYITGRHSFRHAYGTYLLNYIPTGPGQYGLPIGIVRIMMGHAKVGSTEQYAVHDKDILEAQLAYSHVMAFQGESVKSLDDLKIEALRAQIAKIEAHAKRNSPNLNGCP